MLLAFIVGQISNCGKDSSSFNEIEKRILSKAHFCFQSNDPEYCDFGRITHKLQVKLVRIYKEFKSKLMTILCKQVELN